MQSKEREVETLLTRGVEEIIEKDHLTRALYSGKKLRVKFGIDPTKPDIHLGHTVPLMKLLEFQNLGHKAVLIIGDFTAQIGDPSGQSAERKPLTEKEIKANLKHYLAQAGKVIDIKKAEVHYNSEWLKKLNGQKLAEILLLVSVQQMIERNDFKQRLKSNESLRMQELLYPIFQGYDSVVVNADVEIGGSDQKFNLLTGRTLMERFGKQAQDCMTMPLLEGTDGVRKMSKSFGNYIGITEQPDEMFGKIMSVPDVLITKYYELLTKVDPPKDSDPYHTKLLLAETIVAMYHSSLSAKKAKESFIKVFSKKEIPEDIAELKIKNKETGVIELLVAAGISSKSEARRLVLQKAVTINNSLKIDPQEILSLRGGEVLKIGKHRFFRISL